MSKIRGIHLIFWSFVTTLILGFGINGLAFEGEIEIGAAVSLTGKYSTNGKHTKNGYELAVQIINQAGGINVAGKRYKLITKYYDDESTTARGAQLVERLIRQDKIKYILGPYSSGLTKAIAPITEKYKIPMVEGNGASLSLFNKGYKYLFAVLSTTEQYLKTAIELAAEQAIKDGKSPKSIRVAMAFENDPFSQDVREGVMGDIKKFGMQIVIDDKLPPELNDMAATLNKVRAIRPDLLVVSGHAKGATLVVRQLNQMRVYIPMLAITHCDSAKVEKLGAYVNYTLCASQWDRTLSYRGYWFGSAEAFAILFEKTYGYTPPYQAAESAAAVLVFANAFEKAGSLDTEKVRDAIAATEIQTFYGNIKFDSTGKNIAKPMILYQIQDQKYKVVAPLKWASSKFLHPRPR